MNKVGIEIEFIPYDYYKLIDILKSYNCVISFDARYTNSEELILKPECTVKGCELNIPPNFDKLKELCKDLQPLVHFNDRCAMHIHVSSIGIDLNKLNEYYINNEASIIKEADYRYVDLNFSNAMKGIGRRRNMNIFASDMKHKTIEHRIYKATFNHDDIMFAVEQTLNIIENSQKDKEENMKK